MLKVALRKEVRAEIIHEFRINQRAANAEVKYDMLKGKAFAKRHNLIICGLPEDTADMTDWQVAKEFFKNRLELPHLQIDVAYRLGTYSAASSNPRPLAVRFMKIADRWKVWNRRAKIDNLGKRSAWIQEDLPKQLREDQRVLLRIAKCARAQPKVYGNPRVKDFELQLNGHSYAVGDVRKLPADLQPEVVYTPRSDNSVVFFTKHSPLSNHHRASFSVEGTTFSCVEQYLAYHKATMLEYPDLATSAMETDDPADHKVILNMLKNEQVEIWHQKAEQTAYTAVREKFKQNKRLADFLVATYPRVIGEASRDTFWGTGLPLESKDTLNSSKWAEGGNLLGRILIAVRQELIGPTLSQEVSQIEPQKEIQQK